MHQLGYELPDRTGFAGVWDAVSESPDSSHPTVGDVASAPQIVARSEGPSSDRTRRVIEAFRRMCCDVETDDAAA